MKRIFRWLPLLLAMLLLLSACDLTDTGEVTASTTTSAVQSTADSSAVAEESVGSSAVASSPAESSAALPQSSTSAAASSAAEPSSALPESTASTATSSAQDAESSTAAEQLLAQMSLEEKVGQLFVIRPEALVPGLTAGQINDVKANGVTTVTAEMQQMLQQYPVGGIALFSKNIIDPQQITALNSALQGASKTPLLIGVDEEGGRVARIAGNSAFSVTKYGSMQQIGNTGDSQNAFQVGITIGSYLSKYGFNLDFAPVSDTNTNPQNIVIGDRSFGSDPQMVSKMVSAEIDGLHQAGVMSCIKHFPGHGDTKGDTHNGYVSVQKDWNALKQCELIPFVGSLQKTDLVMAAHITVPNVTTDGLPASMSHQMLTDRLRGELGYDGVIITDSMFMGAITKEYSSAKAAVTAFCAGADLILMPEDFLQAYEGVLEAVNNGEISMAELDRSVLRILSLKEKYGLLA